MSASRLALFAVAVTAVFAAAPSAFAQPDPALAGVCYATLGNNASSPGALITINPTTGVGTLVGPTGIVGQFGDDGVPALAIKSSGEMFAMDIGTASKLYRVDATTGAATLVVATSLSSPPAIAFDGADVLWAVDNTGKLYTVVDSTGAARLIGATGAFIKGLAFDPMDGTLWGTDASGGVFTLDVHTGAATLVGNTGLAASPDIHFDTGGILYASSGGGLAVNNLISIDKSTGVGTVVGSIGYASVAGMASRLDRIVPAALQAYRASWTGDGIEVAWSLIDTQGDVTFDVARARVDERYAPLGDIAVERRGDGEFFFVDDAVAPGATYRYRVIVVEDGRALTSFETSVEIPAAGLSLGQNTPNPFNPTTQIGYTLALPVHVSLEIYDVAGRRVRTLVDRAMQPGSYSELWDGRDGRGAPLSSGVYFYRLSAGSQVLTKKMVLLK